MIKASTRAGHIGMPTIRSAWTGATLGQANGNVETTRHVVKGSYSLGMAIGFQKSTAQGLLADVTAGSPQRFLFASTQDPSLPEEQPQHPGPLKVELELPSGPSMFVSLRKGTLHFAEEINATLWEENHRKVRGEATEADEAGLPEAVDDGEVRSVAVRSGQRSQVSLDDWHLAEMMYETSKAVIRDLLEYGRDAADQKEEAWSERLANREARAQLAKSGATAKVQRITLNIYGHATTGVFTVGDHRRRLAGRDRPLFSDALDYAIGMKWLTVAGDKVSVGVAAPPDA